MQVSNVPVGSEASFRLIFPFFLYFVFLPIHFFPCGVTRRGAGTYLSCIWAKGGYPDMTRNELSLFYNWNKLVVAAKVEVEKRSRIWREKDYIRLHRNYDTDRKTIMVQYLKISQLPCAVFANRLVQSGTGLFRSHACLFAAIDGASVWRSSPLLSKNNNCRLQRAFPPTSIVPFLYSTLTGRPLQGWRKPSCVWMEGL